MPKDAAARVVSFYVIRFFRCVNDFTALPYADFAESARACLAVPRTVAFFPRSTVPILA